MRIQIADMYIACAMAVPMNVSKWCVWWMKEEKNWMEHRVLPVFSQSGFRFRIRFFHLSDILWALTFLLIFKLISIFFGLVNVYGWHHRRIDSSTEIHIDDNRPWNRSEFDIDSRTISDYPAPCRKVKKLLLLRDFTNRYCTLRKAEGCPRYLQTYEGSCAVWFLNCFRASSKAARSSLFISWSSSPFSSFEWGPLYEKNESVNVFCL